MEKFNMTVTNIEIEEHILVKFFMEAKIDGTLYDLDKSVRLGEWNDEEKKLEVNDEKEAKGMALIEETFGVSDLAELGTIIGNEYEFFMSDEGTIYFDEPVWYADKVIMDELHAKVEKPKADLADKLSKGIIEHIHTSDNGTTLFIEVTGKNGKGKHVLVNYRYGSYDENNQFKRTFKKKAKAEKRIKTTFGLNSMEELQDMVGQTVVLHFLSAPNGSVYTTCSGLDE